ncbi:MAG TPA: TlpA disulfide reductase family protein [Pyrinomonadaceae bacterium]|jgi:thiol-disulfide isomerase/thioredoxin
MDSSIKTATTAAPEAATAQARLSAHLNRSFELQGEGQLSAAIIELETALREARATPDEVEFQTRVMLAMALADAYQAGGETEKARRVLAEEKEFGEQFFQRTVATGTLLQKRMAAGGVTQIRDRATQLSLIGREAPEISIQTWINSEPLTLADLRGRVVLLEFWATWCKPCQEMFPKLRKLHEEYGARGLSVVALTRHYFAQRGTAASESEEIELIGKVVKDNGLEFPVGVALDERVQSLYGATGVPTLALIDRSGIVRYAHFGGGEDDRFDEILNRCLDEKF